MMESALEKEAREQHPHLRTLEEVRDEHIQRVLTEVGGNKMKAARILGVDRRTLYRHGEKGKSVAR
jgi:ActR/RegA family two-component response regulator